MSFHATPPKQTIPQSLPSYDARDLTQGNDLAHIVHEGQVYTLRITRSNKLILTK